MMYINTTTNAVVWVTSRDLSFRMIGSGLEDVDDRVGKIHYHSFRWSLGEGASNPSFESQEIFQQFTVSALLVAARGWDKEGMERQTQRHRKSLARQDTNEKALYLSCRFDWFGICMIITKKCGV